MFLHEKDRREEEVEKEENVDNQGLKKSVTPTTLLSFI